MLLKCIECNHEVSEYADMCPHCGCPIDKIKEGLQTDVVSVEDVKETVASTSFDVSKIVCPVCKNECESGAEVCAICGFNELHKEFISKEDGNLWLETVVIPYRTEWENSQVDLSDFEIEGTVLKKYKGNAEKVVIPNGVLSIGDKAFDYCRNLIEIAMPNNVKSIGNYAFSCCINLSKIIMSNSVQSIGEGAFLCCKRLTEVTIPNSVKSIGDSAFSDCISLTAITVNEGNKKYISENGILFSKDKTILVRFPAGKKEKSYKIPNNVQSVGVGAFYNCKDLTEIIIPNSVQSIGIGAFNGCQNLIKITLPNSVKSIGRCAFQSCSNLSEIGIPNNVQAIGDFAFAGCEKLIEIRIPDSVKSIGTSDFYKCKNLKKAYIPRMLNIQSNIFEDCHPDLEIIRY